MISRLKLYMDAEGLPFNAGRNMTFNSRLAQEIAKWGETKTDTEALHLALYQAYFVDGLNIGQAGVLLDVIEKVGLSRTDARDVIEQRTMRLAVDEDWRYARNIGVTSVPTFAVGLRGVVGAQPYETLASLVEQNGATKRA